MKGTQGPGRAVGGEINVIELRYEIFKSLVDKVYGASLLSPSPGKPLRIGVVVRDPAGEVRKFTISVEEDR
ncbi:hypothetical protein [Streptomyces sp. NBC_01500]|uniref:hypothetical protein n=1 Tax=Streptomyces sp. NBC_01500 TaxID=2903886 RepID=UPI002255E4D2|nr:hypothetical protein [Streptomyces sp. NBC_01500]MCX4554152.1 hypothetical protein [Streptomyces sp. NBC_01500]